MNVVGLMTADARAELFRLPRVGSGAMTRSAFQLEMRAVDLKLRLFVVIEQPQRPVVRVVAQIAARP